MVVIQPVSLYIVNEYYWLAEVFELEINSNIVTNGRLKEKVAPFP